VIGHTDGYDWRIERRRLDSGALDAGFGSGGVVTSAAGRIAYGIAIDSTYMYVVGYDDATNWRIEKRTLATGALDAGFGTGGVVTSAAASEIAYSLAIDSTYMYVVGSEGAGPNWRIEKRLLSTGALVGAFGSGGVVSSLGGEEPRDIAIDSSYMYVVGYLNTGSDRDWHIERRRLDTGALDAGFGSGGVVTSPAGYRAMSISIDSAHMYLTGDDNSNPPPSDWRIESRRVDTGALDPAFGSGGVVTSVSESETSWASAIDSSSLYAVGWDQSPDWRIEKFSLRRWLGPEPGLADREALPGERLSARSRFD